MSTLYSSRIQKKVDIDWWHDCKKKVVIKTSAIHVAGLSNHSGGQKYFYIWRGKYGQLISTKHRYFMHTYFYILISAGDSVRLVLSKLFDKGNCIPIIGQQKFPLCIELVIFL